VSDSSAAPPMQNGALLFCAPRIQVKMFSEVDTLSASDLVNVALAGDSQRILQLLNVRYARNQRVAPILEDWVIPMLHECGLRWERGQFSVADEHVVTNVVIDALAGVRMQFARVRSRGTAATVTLGGDEHDIGSRLAQACLESPGVLCAMLGRGLSACEIAEWVTENSPDLLCCSIPITLRPDDAERELRTLLSGLQPRVRVLIGGAGAKALRIIPPDVEIVHSLRELEAMAASMTEQVAGF
jgi:methanogenic corrinoid protein MtbC1